MNISSLELKTKKSLKLVSSMRNFYLTAKIIREVAEAVGLNVPASKYRENISNHFMYGSNKRIPKHMTDYGDKA